MTIEITEENEGFRIFHSYDGNEGSETVNNAYEAMGKAIEILDGWKRSPSKKV